MSFKSNGTTVFLISTAEYVIDCVKPRKAGRMDLVAIKDILKKTEYGSFLGRETIYLDKIIICNHGHEYLQELEQVIKRSGFDGFSHDYYYSSLDNFLGLISYGGSQIEITIPMYKKKVTAKWKKAPDGFVKIYNKVVQKS